MRTKLNSSLNVPLRYHSEQTIKLNLLVTDSVLDYFLLVITAVYSNTYGLFPSTIQAYLPHSGLPLLLCTQSHATNAAPGPGSVKDIAWWLEGKRGERGGGGALALLLKSIG